MNDCANCNHGEDCSNCMSIKSTIKDCTNCKNGFFKNICSLPYHLIKWYTANGDIYCKDYEVRQ